MTHKGHRVLFPLWQSLFNECYFNMINQKILRVKNLLLTICLLCAMANQTIAAPTQNPPVLQKISLQLSWKHQFQFAGFYAAIEQGYQ